MNFIKKELFSLYVQENKTIREISKILKISQSGVFCRLEKLGISTIPHLKKNYLMGLVSNKTKKQVDVPRWIFKKPQYMKACLRGFFDTDGSVYKLKFGNQISLCNTSKPLLRSLQGMLLTLKYKPSSVSGKNLYLTRREDLNRFYLEIGSNNSPKNRRLTEIVRKNASVG